MLKSTPRKIFFLRLVLICGYCLLGVTDLWAQNLYTVSFPDAASNHVHVELKIQQPPETLELMMPTWTPGSYLIREYSRFMESESATDAKGQPLTVNKTRKNRWTIQCGKQDSIVFSYDLYCRELSVRTNWVDRELAVLNGAATFVVPVDQLDQPLQVHVVLPENWPRSVSALSDVPQKPHHYQADNFHQLVDNPILCGDCHIHPFEVGGVPHALVNLGDDEAWDAQKCVADLTRIVQAHQDFWGVVPYERYLFLNVIRGGGGGLEHDQCTLIMGNRFTCRSERSYKSWLTLASHEFFHTWNVRRLRPAALTQYDYENEVYLRQLWIAEGITSYYENILAARAGVVNQKDILRSLGSEIRSVESTLGNQIQSLSDASFDAWIKFYRPHENSRNTTISYYSRGAVVAFLLDMEIRQATNNQKSLDDVMVQMYQQFVPSGYSSEDFRAMCNQVAGKDLTPWFQNYVDQPGALKYEQAWEFLGLQFDDQTPKEPKAELGASLTDSSGKITVRSITPDSAASRAGLDIDDEILAVDGHRATSSSLANELDGKKPGDLIQLLIARRGQVRTLPLQLQAADHRQYGVSTVKEPSEAQKEHLAQWLNLEVEEKTAEKDTPATDGDGESAAGKPDAQKTDDTKQDAQTQDAQTQDAQTPETQQPDAAQTDDASSENA